MLPQIKHSRSNLRSKLIKYENGAISFFVSSDTYPEIFNILFPSIKAKTDKDWEKKNNMKYLWFLQDALNDDDISSIENWEKRFKQYVLIGINKNIEGYFKNELDFCIALDFNFDKNIQHTHFGEIEYEMKYKNNYKDFNEIIEGMSDLYNYLPLNPKDKNTKKILISSIPENKINESIAKNLAKKIAVINEVKYLQASLNCEKKELKNLDIDKKITEWKKVYSIPSNISLSNEIEDKTIVIIDDLYQSGVSMWSYAKYLKKIGAKQVLGMACVKSLSDSDNK